MTSQGHLAAWPPSPGHTQPSPALARGSAAAGPAAPLCQWPTGEGFGPESARGSKLGFIPASLLLRSLGREEGLGWPLARGQLTMKCKSQLSPDPSALCREIPHSHLPPSFQSRCLEGWAHTGAGSPQVGEEVNGKRRSMDRSFISLVPVQP